MKIFISLILLFSISTVPVFAAQMQYKSQQYLEEEVAIIEPGVLPNSFWYWTDIFAEEIRFIFTVGKEKKADYLIQMADERLAEMQKLSEEGIDKYAEQLMSKHQAHISRAEELYQKLREEGWERVQEEQENLEYEILEKEYQIKKELSQAPEKYKEKRDSFVGSVWSGFKEILSHLKWKKAEISQQRATFEE